MNHSENFPNGLQADKQQLIENNNISNELDTTNKMELGSNGEDKEVVVCILYHIV